ncbi:putative pterin-4-alpha-carbinolamine dehydratase [Golovinomyces cichoracearum]|uniref:4a-hydroxytetrahydrobiopterin dehydratase n=1 Tax=Golovinomyces cichoracearum TaxID=62708 RepID=A0A420IVS2_9PEZI|nr:putative pterin-4-alpha-carbinolamine dehydratase [Golovinomyces cichoracearum]
MITTTAIDDGENQKRNGEEKLVVHFSPGYSKEQGVEDLIGLQKPLGKWSIAADGMGVERSFKFRGFKKTWEFMNLVAAEAVQKKHHPEWSNIYNTVFVRWTTHSPAGLSEKDIIMARFCDCSAKKLGEIVAEIGESTPSKERNLVDDIVSLARDC